MQGYGSIRKRCGRNERRPKKNVGLRIGQRVADAMQGSENREGNVKFKYNTGKRF